MVLSFARAERRCRVARCLEHRRRHGDVGHEQRPDRGRTSHALMMPHGSAGFRRWGRRPYTPRMSDRAVSHQPRVAIIGSGFGGMVVALRLQQQGLTDFTIYEKADDLGGTWRDNTYPGAACDIPSHLYSISFEPKPDWSRRYPPQQEIFDYMESVYERRGLHSHSRFGTNITELRFDEAHNVWQISTTDDEIEADVVVVCTGLLNKPHVPEIAGLDDFDGAVWHSMEWDHEHDLRGERVAVIGTGASSIQFTPEIAPYAANTTVFQRTAPWIVPRDDRPYARWRQWMYRYAPAMRRIHRAKIYFRQEMLALGLLGRARWMLKGAEKMASDFIEQQVPDPVLREKVTPNYEFGCKRVIVSDDWYPTLNRADVDLVTEGIDRVVADGIVTTDGAHRPFDAIALGTGFRTWEIVSPLKVFGAGGIELNDRWAGGAETHLGVSVAGFPNLFMVTGPGTGLGHNSMIFMIEAAANLTVGAIEHLSQRGQGATVDVRPEVAAASYAELQERMGDTVWASGCGSWYLNDEGRNELLWPGFTTEYWRKTRHFDPAAYLQQ